MEEYSPCVFLLLVALIARSSGTPSPSLAIKPTRVSIATDRHCVQLQHCQHLPYIPAPLTWYQADLGQSVKLPMLDSVLSKSRHPGLSQHSPHFDVYKILVQLLLWTVLVQLRTTTQCVWNSITQHVIHPVSGSPHHDHERWEVFIVWHNDCTVADASSMNNP